MASLSWKLGLAGLAVVAATAYAVAQMPPGHSGMHGGPDAQGATPQTNHDGSMHDRMMKMMQGQPGNMGQHGMMGMSGGMGGQPTMPGQDAFGAIQEVVQMLEADPKTDWSKVNIAALREHLIDMNEVTLHANASERPLDNGLEIAVTGDGRTLQAIKRMVPAHVSELVKVGLGRKDGGNAQRREAHGHNERCQASREAQGSRLHGDYGAGGASSDAPSHDGKRRTRSLIGAASLALRQLRNGRERHPQVCLSARVR